MRANKLVLWILALPLCAFGQSSTRQATLPSAPVPQPSPIWRSALSYPDTEHNLQTQVAPSATVPGATQPNPQTPSSQTGAPSQTDTANPTGSPPQTLTLKDAEKLARKNNPQISVARLLAMAQQQVTREVRSSLWPAANADITTVDSQENSRISAGGLNNPIIYERAAGGVTVSQLITDFGRTNNLVASANLTAKAEAQNAIATQEQILLEVNQAFFSALQTHAVLKVAEETVNERGVVADQIGALAKNKLRSDLDLSFANVNLAQAKLLLLDAQNNDKAALANLSAVLGYSTEHDFILVEEQAQAVVPPGDVDSLIAQAFANRPEMLALNYQFQASQKMKTAERDLLLPSIRALGTVGGAPVRNDHLSSWYGAVGANVNIPIFNGFLYTARAHEADLRSQAVRDRLTDLRNRLSRDVRTSWLSANNAYQRLAVTQQLLEQVQLALDLAQARYKLGLSSIVELSQAQLQATQAEISNAQAGYDYRLSQAVLRYETTGL
jgi:outer membrane protein